MKKFISLILALAMIICFGACGKKEAKGPGCYVTIVKSDGNFAIADEFVEFNDYDGNGSYNVNEVLKAAHAQYGKEDDYAVESSGMISKLWGESFENMNPFGFFVDNVSANGLDDPVTEGQYVVAYVYQDREFWSDAYSFFEKAEVKDGNLTVSLSKIGYDANWAPVVGAAADVEIFVNDKSVGKTDENGNLTYKLNGEKELVVTAKGIGLVSAVARPAEK